MGQGIPKLREYGRAHAVQAFSDLTGQASASAAATLPLQDKQPIIFLHSSHTQNHLYRRQREFLLPSLFVAIPQTPQFLFGLLSPVPTSTLPHNALRSASCDPRCRCRPRGFAPALPGRPCRLDLGQRAPGPSCKSFPCHWAFFPCLGDRHGTDELTVANPGCKLRPQPVAPLPASVSTVTLTRALCASGHPGYVLRTLPGLGTLLCTWN